MDHVVLEIDLHLINNIRVIYYVVTAVLIVKTKTVRYNACKVDF
ncbi:hypothetical protein EfmJHP38_15700 [Enterococcus faecium]|nr:hypothetical protein EfmJHP38_15700 [Enterococcus faecium]